MHMYVEHYSTICMTMHIYAVIPYWSFPCSDTNRMWHPCTQLILKTSYIINTATHRLALNIYYI